MGARMMGEFEIAIRAAAGQPEAMAAMVARTIADAESGASGIPTETVLGYAESWARKLAASDPTHKPYLRTVLAHCAGWLNGVGNAERAMTLLTEVFVSLLADADAGDEAAAGQLLPLCDAVPPDILALVASRIARLQAGNL